MTTRWQKLCDYNRTLKLKVKQGFSKEFGYSLLYAPFPSMRISWWEMCLLFKEFTPARRKVISSSLSEKKSMTEMWTNPMFKELRAQIHEKWCCSTCWLEQISMISTTRQCCFYIRLFGDICFINFTYLHYIWSDTIGIKEFTVCILKFSSHGIFVSARFQVKKCMPLCLPQRMPGRRNERLWISAYLKSVKQRRRDHQGDC